MNGRLRHIVFPVVIVAMMVYFTYHIFQGQRGVLAWIRLDKKLKEEETTLNALTQEKEQLEREAYLLRPDSLDVDLLEEKARQALNFAHPNEVVVQGTDK
ncbi:MAG: septum formation initiator family protein [Proteobacteria bacterium]|jgi:cell division protein FtsB|nr:septum formation initiator family protein [Pseudomonadota bacterium]